MTAVSWKLIVFCGNWQAGMSQTDAQQENFDVGNYEKLTH